MGVRRDYFLRTSLSAFPEFAVSALVPPGKVALRDALEGVRDTVEAHGVYNMSAQDHVGFDQRSRMMVKIENGEWKLGH